MPGTMDQVDCACPEATRTKRESEACACAADCAPGLLCNLMADDPRLPPDLPLRRERRRRVHHTTQ